MFKDIMVNFFSDFDISMDIFTNKEYFVVMKNNLTTVFVMMPQLMKGNYPYRACIVKWEPTDPTHPDKLTFVKWIKPVTYHHRLPEFLREEFTRKNGKLLKPKDIENLPEIATRTPEKKPEIVIAKG